MPHGMHALNVHARMYYGNSVRLNKTKIRWKAFVLFLIYRKFLYYSVWFLTLQLCGRCMLYIHFDAVVEHSLLDYVINVVANNYLICYCCYTKSTIL